MNRKTSDRDILFEFESLWNSGSYSVAEFINERARSAGTELKLALIRLEVKLRLISGQIPAALDYETAFPEFSELIGGIVADEIIQFTKDERPIEGALATLPETAGNYQVVECVGRDPVSVHYHASQIPLGRNVKLRALLFSSDSMLTKARLAAKIEHANLENIIDLFESDGVNLVASQLETGEVLSNIIRGKFDLISPQHAASWVRSIASALVEMHRCGIAHQNISASNIVIRFGGDAVLLNPLFDNPFGCEYPCSKVQKAINPFPYRSIDCKSKTAFESDKVALGVTLFQLLTGLTLDSFFEEDPLPAELERMKKLIDDQLNYLKDADDQLKDICKRSTLGLIDGNRPCRIEELVEELSAWEESMKQRTGMGNAGVVGSPKSKLRKSMKGLPWIGN